MAQARHCNDGYGVRESKWLTSSEQLLIGKNVTGSGQEGDTCTGCSLYLYKKIRSGRNIPYIRRPSGQTDPPASDGGFRIAELCLMGFTEWPARLGTAQSAARTRQCRRARRIQSADEMEYC